jgi:hypothetical protein
VITVHTVVSLKLDSFGTNTVVITNTIAVNYPRASEDESSIKIT